MDPVFAGMVGGACECGGLVGEGGDGEDDGCRPQEEVGAHLGERIGLKVRGRSTGGKRELRRDEGRGRGVGMEEGKEGERC